MLREYWGGVLPESLYCKARKQVAQQGSQDGGTTAVKQEAVPPNEERFPASENNFIRRLPSLAGRAARLENNGTPATTVEVVLASIHKESVRGARILLR